jgi:hypothetical protein
MAHRRWNAQRDDRNVEDDAPWPIPHHGSSDSSTRPHGHPDAHVPHLAAKSNPVVPAGDIDEVRFTDANPVKNGNITIHAYGYKAKFVFRRKTRDEARALSPAASPSKWSTSGDLPRWRYLWIGRTDPLRPQKGDLR